MAWFLMIAIITSCTNENNPRYLELSSDEYYEKVYASWLGQIVGLIYGLGTENKFAENPFNPSINNTYNATDSRLPEVIDYPAQNQNNPFFRTVPELENNLVVLEYQQKFGDKLMSVALEYPNVLYCIDNETKAPPEWGRYWSAYIRNKAPVGGAAEKALEVYK